MEGLTKLAPGAGHVGLAEREEREPAAGEVLIEVHGAGICGTDLHIEAGEFPTRPPVTMGHEVAGTVISVGDGVEPAWLGATVVSETYFSTCGTCRWCRDGRTNLCPDRRSIGSLVDGAFAPRLVVPAINLHRIPEWLDPHAAVLVEPLACVCHCLCAPPVVTAGDRVLVTGPGPVGLLAAQVARALGGDVLVVGLPQDDQRLDAARALGLRTAHATEAGADVVIECSGAAGGAIACLDAAGRRARYVQVGVFGKDVCVPLDQVFRKELTMSSGFASTPASWQRALRFVETRRVVLEPLVSSVVPLREWARVFAELRQARGIKVVFDPRLP
ncbi:MAG: alcohol dehydrogenase catalytic domain-containing protein [Acidobacteria bacterium]|nr:alcohol dehydrogenase catalytic domain-containing protein [Acidobacteriota bacterium]